MSDKKTLEITMRIRFAILLAVLLVLTGCTMPGAGADPTPTLIPFTPGADDSTAQPTAETPTEAPAEVAQGVDEAPTATPTDTPPPLPTPTPIVPTDAPPPTDPPAPTVPPPPADPVEIASAVVASDTLDQLWAQAYDLPAGVPFTITITEAQIEAAVAEAMAISGYGDNLSGYDVSLNNGQIGLTMSYTLPAPVSRTVTATAVFAVTVTPDGSIAVTVVSASISGAAGSADLPPEVTAALNAAITAALNGDAVASGDVTITAITISGGQMTIEGYATP